ncbi:hypothetical protein FOXYS1_7774 [Fusarium oxysporum]|uniref:Uncharacterized protein n=1 Tax=Fusarium oxysporum TaxID=5507 RepID=A0A8H5EI47_FUSOX|nr:hypothetical protein FOXYS1_7774 [Fusarium oxysporum]
MLDTEILAQLMPVPKDLSCNTTEHFRSPYWLNMVEAKPNTNTNTKEVFRVGFLVTRRKKGADAGVLCYGPTPFECPPEMEKYDEAFRKYMHGEWDAILPVVADHEWLVGDGPDLDPLPKADSVEDTALPMRKMAPWAGSQFLSEYQAGML